MKICQNTPKSTSEAHLMIPDLHLTTNREFEIPKIDIKRRLTRRISAFAPVNVPKNRLLLWLESNYTTAFMTFITIYALFGDDIRTSSFSKSSDDVFYSLATICLCLFLLEFILCCFLKTDYIFSFYFWLDLVSTLSLIPDIGWIWDPIIGVSDDSTPRDSSKLKSISQTSKAGTRTSRVIRIIRIVRLIRIARLYKNAKNVLSKEVSDNEDDAEIYIPSESKVGKRLGDLTIKRVITLVLTMLFVMPLFDIEYWYTPYHSWDYGLTSLDKFLYRSDYETVRDSYIDFHKDDVRPIIYLNIDLTDSTSYVWVSEDTNYNDLRYNEKYYSISDTIQAIFDIRYESRLNGQLSICKTIFICVLLTLGSIYFTKDAELLVIKPIEKMMAIVTKIAKNPISATQRYKTAVYDMMIPSRSRFCICCSKTNEQSADYETQLLEKTIYKIGVLLALSFGEAGSAIIGKNLERSGDIDPLIKGNKIAAIFGFCDIRNFTDSTEELQQDVMVFVNEIARIVHYVVDIYQGFANKNIGDAFLMVWKFNENDVYILDNRLEVKLDSKRAKYLPDLALFSFLKILAKINKDSEILKYRSNVKLTARMPNYEVKMGFGLHLGWAIEGAIGSRFKIDASYLSPDVNMASRLEAATKQYGVPLLFSGNFFDLLSHEVQSYCRHIDTVNVKGSQNPTRIYTSDTDFSDFLPSVEKHRSKDYSNDKRKLLKKRLDKGDISSYDIFAASSEIKMMTQNFTYEFAQIFQSGMKAYTIGNWSVAKEKLEECLRIRQNDGPSKALIEFLFESNFESPQGWLGYRVLNEK